MSSSDTEPDPVQRLVRPWTMTLATFGFLGPPIGVMSGLLGLWVSEAVSAPADMAHAGIVGLTRLPGYWALSYLATPPAMLAGAVMILASRRYAKPLVAVMVVTAAVVASWLWYGGLLAVLGMMRSFSWSDSGIFAGLGGVAALGCFLFASRKGPKAVQPSPAVTQSAG